MKGMMIFSSTLDKIDGSIVFNMERIFFFENWSDFVNFPFSWK